MPIPRKEAREILKKIGLRYGGFTVEPTVDSDYAHIDVFSNELPISRKNEFKLAERIGNGHGLKLTQQDFSPGEKGELTEYETVYALSCKSLNELKKASEKISTAIAELEKGIDMVKGKTIKG